MLYEKRHIYDFRVDIKDGKVLDTCSILWGCCVFKEDKALYQWTEIEDKKCTDELKKAIHQIIHEKNNE